MDSSTMQTLIESLSSEIDDLETSLSPLLTTPITSLTTRLPILDKSKLYVLSTYAIESLLFSYIRLSGADARSHPVFTELARVKQYFDKIKNAENPQAAKPRDLRLDKGAAKRFITAALAGNRSYDEEREGRKDLEKEELGLKRKLDNVEGEQTQIGASESPIPSKKSKKEKKHKSSKIPKGPKEAFQALLKGASQDSVTAEPQAKKKPKKQKPGV